MDLSILIPAIVAFLAALVFVPMVRWTARKIGLVDNPDAERKLHSQPIALAGGIGVFASMIVGIGIYLGIVHGWSLASASEMMSQRWLVLLGSAVAILLVGMVDDAWTLRGRQKLLAQCVIAMVIVGSGTSLSVVGILNYDIPLGVFALPVSVLWLLLAINALNLLDGADGMATTVGVFVAASIAIVTILNGSINLNVVTALALAGALVGFLFYNRPPATIFLGDAGSMMIGLMLGVLSMWSSSKESTLVAAAPIAILVLPLFDSSAAIIRRWMTGRSMYVTDRGHLHHRLREKFGPVGMLWVVAGACTLSSTAAILSTHWDQQWLAPLGAIIVLGLFIGTRTFGHSECRLLFTRLWHLAMSFLVRPEQCETVRQERSVQLQGDGPWKEVWEPLKIFAENQELSKIKIDVNMAWLHEGYHASWQGVRLPEKAFQNVVKVPLFAERASGDLIERVPIGRLEIVAPSTHDSFVKLADFLEQAEELQAQVLEVVARIELAQKSKLTEATELANQLVEAKKLPASKKHSSEPVVDKVLSS